MANLVPFFAADQGLVDNLCEIIQQLELVLDIDPAHVFADQKTLELFNRITKE